MGLMPGVDDRVHRLAPHASCTQQVKGWRNNSAIQGFDSAGCLQHLTRPGETMVEHSQAILTERVGHSGGWNPIRVSSLRVQLDMVDRLRQIFSQDGDANNVRKAPSHRAMVLS